MNRGANSRARGGFAGLGDPGMDTLAGNTWDLPGSGEVLTRQERIAQLAREMPDKALTAVSRYLDEGWLLAACVRTRRDGAVGIAAETWEDFAVSFRERLTSLR